MTKVNGLEDILLKGERLSIKLFFTREIKQYNRKWLFPESFSEIKVNDNIYKDIILSMQYGIRNINKIGIYHNESLVTLYNNILFELLENEFYPKAVNAFSSLNKEEIKLFMINNLEKIFLPKMKEVFSFDYFLLQFAYNIPDKVIRYTIFPKGIHQFIKNESNFDFITRYTQDEVEELEYDGKFVEYQRIPKYRGYIINVLQFLKINPWDFKREYNNQYANKINKRFPNFPERRGNEIIDLKELYYNYFDVSNSEFVPLSIFANIKMNYLIYCMLHKKKFIEFPKKSIISFFDQEEGRMLITFSSIKSVYVPLNKCDIEYKKTGTTLMELSFDKKYSIAKIDFPKDKRDYKKPEPNRDAIFTGKKPYKKIIKCQ